MSSALERWKARTVREVELPSGTKVGIQLVTIADLILAGAFPASILPLARGLASQSFDADKEMNDEELTNFRTFQHVVVARSVNSLDGEPIELVVDEDRDDVAGIPDDDRSELWLYAMRVKALPKAQA